MQLSPQTIEKLSNGNGTPLITPFKNAYIDPESGLSGGLSCAGYDVTLLSATLAPNTESGLVNTRGIGLGPGACCLGVTVERFALPSDICMYYINKSTLARQFIDASATLAEPGWQGHLTLEIKNNSNIPIALNYGQPIGQVVFHYLDKPSAYPYKGKYQHAAAKPQEAK